MRTRPPETRRKQRHLWVTYLAQIGLVVKKAANRKTAPVIAYDKLLLEIAV